MLDEYASDRKHILVFLPNVATTEQACAILEEAGISVGLIHGGTPKEERESVLERFRKGEIRVLCNCMILTEGVDIPCIDAILIARATKSATLMQQMLGRGLRQVSGGSNCLFIDLAYERRQKDLISVAGAGIFGDVSDVHLKHPQMSFMELIAFQQERVPYLTKLAYMLEKRAEELKEEEELKPVEVAHTPKMPAWLQNHLAAQNSVLLFIDTEVLRTLCADTDIEAFYYDLYEAMKSMNPNRRTRAASQKQIDYLLRHNFDPELIELLSEGNASAIIGTLIKHKKTSEKQRNLLKGKFGLTDAEIPATMRESNLLLDKLFVQNKRQPLWAQAGGYSQYY